jgi:N-acetylmuramoyl-L-alanine amidase
MSGRKNRLRKRLLHAAVEDNLETIRGLAPRPLRRGRRLWNLWSRRSLVVLFPLSLVGGSYLASTLLLPTTTANATAVATTPPAAFSVASRELNLKTTFPPPQAMKADVLALGVRRVVIDAGHGGANPGTSASGGMLEKDLTIDISERLRQLLEDHGLEVIMTRVADQTVTLKERARLANEGAGDIFVSIHLNALKHKHNRGVETYYLGPTNDPYLQQIAAAENRESGYSLADMRNLLDRIYADVRQEESKLLAEKVQRSILNNLRKVNPSIEDRGVKTAPFVVLVATEMPAILAEVSCLSNDEEAELLKKPEYRQTIAEALFAGIRSYAGDRALTDGKGI